MASTESLCPFCLRRVPARKTLKGNSVYLEKSCPEHGDPGPVLLWNNSRRTYGDWSRRGVPDVDAAEGCPHRCGLCPEHAQHTCTAIIEITHRCNLCCPVCFADAGHPRAPEPGIRELSAMLQELLRRAGPCPIQLSGGEPTLRNDLPEIVSAAKSAGFDHVQVNTNGIRLATDEGFLKDLASAGVSDFFLQFDGVTDGVYERIRGAGLLDLKIRAIERCAEQKTGVILVPTLVKGVNDSQIGAVIQFAKSWIPAVKGVHFQPLTYLGRYPHSPGNEGRFLLSDVLGAIEDQTGGELKVENFVPPG